LRRINPTSFIPAANETFAPLMFHRLLD
jgi:hypothetical protein